MSAQTSESSVAGAAYGVLAALIWAGFPAITKLSMASHTLTAWDVTALRFATAGLLTLPLFVRHGLRPLHLSGALLLAVGAGAPYVLLTAGGLAFAPAAHMGVITPSCMLLCRDGRQLALARRQADRAAALRACSRFSPEF